MGVTRNDIAIMGQMMEDTNITFHHFMYFVSSKTKKQIERSLELYIQYLERQHTEYKYKTSSFIELKTADQIKFLIEFERK